MKQNSRRHFDREFKHNALRMILDEGVPLEEIARKLDIHRNILHRWKTDFLNTPDNAFPGKGNRSKSVEEENQKLRNRLRDTEEERDVLKKALSIFSRPKNDGSNS